MHETIQQQIDDYQKRIAQQEGAIALMEKRCNALRDELSDFEERYNRIVKPIANQLDAVKKAVASLRELRQKNQTLDDFLRRVSLPPRPDDPTMEPPSLDDDTAGFDTIPPADASSEIKTLYRKLARRYHPDLATDDADRQRRTRLMSLINRAYQDNDLETLQMLDEQIADDDTRTSTAQTTSQDAMLHDTRLPLALITLRRLQQQYRLLGERLRDLQAEYQQLQHGSLMELKREDHRARQQGEDMLTELAEDMKREYWQYMRELDALRSELQS